MVKNKEKLVKVEQRVAKTIKPLIKRAPILVQEPHTKPPQQKATTIKHKMLTKNGYVIKKSMLNEEKLVELKSELTVKPKVHPDFDTGVESYPIYTEDENFMYIPRFYGIKKFGKYTSTNLDEIGINIEFKGILQDEQKIIVDTCHKKILEDGGGVISVPCGAGKTVMVLDLICRLGLKALFIVPKSCLLKQTMERIQEFTTARVGIIRQSKTVVDNVDIVVGMIHSIAQKQYDESIFKDFGVVVYDECHRTPSRVLSNSFKKAGAKYTIGLSATPRRKDGLIRVMFWNIGNIIYKKDKKKDNRVFVHVVNYDSNDKNYCEKRQYIKREYKPSTVRTMTSLIQVENRNKIINEMIINIILENTNGKITNGSYRKILVLSERLDHLRTLKKLFDESVTRLIINDKINREDAFTSGLYIGEMKQSELDYSSQSDVIYGSYALAKEGLDINDLNVLIMASPQKDIEQAVGRILRKQIQDNDIFPLVIDVCDSLFIFRKWYPERNMYYSKQEYIIQEHEITETELITPKRKLLKDMKITVEQYNEITDHEIRKIYLIDRYGEYHYNSLTEEKLTKYPLEEYASTKTFENMFDIDYSKYICIKTDENSTEIHNEENEEDENNNEDTDEEENNEQEKQNTSKVDKQKINDIIFEDINETSDIFARAKKLKEIKQTQKNKLQIKLKE